MLLYVEILAFRDEIEAARPRTSAFRAEKGENTGRRQEKRQAILQKTELCLTPERYIPPRGIPSLH